MSVNIGDHITVRYAIQRQSPQPSDLPQTRTALGIVTDVRKAGQNDREHQHNIVAVFFPADEPQQTYAGPLYSSEKHADEDKEAPVTRAWIGAPRGAEAPENAARSLPTRKTQDR